MALVGAQWGDEGKGKITDVLAARAHVVARYQGGNNAGHTVVVNGQSLKLHLVPSGILYPGTICILGPGMVVDLTALHQELDYLEAAGVDTAGLRISDRAHLLLPYHRQLDALEEDGRGGEPLGTTRRGIGPAYVDKFARRGLRLGDLLYPGEFQTRLEAAVAEKSRLLETLYGAPPLDAGALYRETMELARRVQGAIVDTSVLLERAQSQGRRVLLEGAQGTLLDIDHGTYPFVTASQPGAGGAAAGSGLGPNRIQRVLGVVKAYTTRVGEGPFPTELEDERGQRLREQGHEYGTTTGRPRRCGWFDGVILKYAIRVNGLDQLALTKLDVLSGLERIQVCTGYQWGDQALEHFPGHLGVLGQCQPRYQELEGWEEDLGQCTSYRQLPRAARRYIQFLEHLARVPVALVSLGPERDQTLFLRHIF